MTFSETFGSARWVSCDCPAPYLRKRFSAPAADRAELTVCGLGHFEAFINDARVSEDLFAPAVSDYEPCSERHCEAVLGERTRHRVYAMRYDVTELLRRGENAIGVRLYPGWYCARTSRPVKLVFRLVICSGEQVLTVCSDDGMRWARSEYTDGNFFRFEDQDAAYIADGFSLPDFDDSSWAPVRLCEGPEGPFYIQSSPADRVIRHIRPRRTGTTAEGAALYDCGENITGWPLLKERGGRVQTLVLTMAEKCRDGELDPAYIHKQICHYTTDGRGRTYRSRSLWHAFRYFTVLGEADCEDVLVVHANCAPSADFTCADPVICAYYDAFVRTQLANMHGGIPSDCPHLERRGYTGDGQLACEAVMTVLDCRDFYLRWIGDISDCQDVISGHVQNTAPYTRSGGGPGGWSCAIAEVPWQYWKAYGDAEPARALYPQMLRYFDYLEAHSEGELVTSDARGEWCLGDWCTPDRIAIPEPYVNTYFYVKTIGRVRQVALLCGDTERAAELAVRAERKKQALLAAYFDPETGDFCGNVQGANLFALDIGLGDERTLENTVAHYRAKPLPDGGIFATDLLFGVLIDHGFAELAFDILGATGYPSFGHWQAQGATTLYEEWHDASRSLSHPMFGAAVRHLFSRLLGISQREHSFGFAHTVISPAFNRRVPSASGSRMTPAGRVSVDWRLFEQDIHLCITLESGMDAVLAFGGEEFALYAGKNEFILPAAGI